MAFVIPPLPPVPCQENKTYVLAIRCVPDGEGTKFEGVWLDTAEFDPSAARVSAPCGGCAKTKLLELAEKGGWTPQQVIKALAMLRK